MARVAMVPPDSTDSAVRKVYDHVLKQWGRISNFSRVLAHQPAALMGWALPNDAIRLGNVKADPDYVKIQQLVIIKTSALNCSAYCMSHNVPLGRKVGLSEAQIKAAQGQDYMASPDLDDRQKAAVRWAEAVTRMTARDDDEAFAAMKRHFTEKQIVELTVFCGMWNYSNRLCEALHVDLERPDKRIEFQEG
ncbi:carboxymuconolactone decarboxylase family protein [Rhodoplanes sp. Z2-YC6860]|uniref:carboxymuconolactone decarboxylase family protein n=1 Tax=Rhodoplanes sp. Z2-YC6860 TaxID=674703 RepID=UPI00078C5327|nr:carboxymuconolactone decarboxylase family protein [Rhodoplanes sp. Z2-YC6860]AMN42844.1 carboxymuconolactone decarboxylase [Rhodoplanes sp. Z2-YC6860]